MPSTGGASASPGSSDLARLTAARTPSMSFAGTFRYSAWSRIRSSSGRAFAARRIRPVSWPSSSAIRGATYPPSEWPSTYTRLGSTSFCWRRSAAARTASSAVSSWTVASRIARIFPAYTSVRLSYRRTAIPRDASPSARSRNTLVPPTASSRVFGPEPCTSTTAGNGPAPLGTVSVPGSFQSSVPTVTGRSVNVPALLYAGGCQGASPGKRNMPATRPAWLTMKRAFMFCFSNWIGKTAMVLEPDFVTCGGSTLPTAPKDWICAPSLASAAAERSFCICGVSIGFRSLYLPASRRSSAFRAVAAGSEAVCDQANTADKHHKRQERFTLPWYRAILHWRNGGADSGRMLRLAGGARPLLRAFPRRRTTGPVLRNARAVACGEVAGVGAAGFPILPEGVAVDHPHAVEPDVPPFEIPDRALRAYALRRVPPDRAGPPRLGADRRNRANPRGGRGSVPVPCVVRPVAGER